MKRFFSVFSGILFSLLIGIVGVFGQENAMKTVSGGVLNGKAISLPKPEYPAEAKKDNAEGSIAVTISIDEEGNVISAAAALNYQTVQKMGDDATGMAEAKPAHLLLREAAEKAAMGAKFAPTQLNGQPVRVTGVIVYKFVGTGEHPEINSLKTINGGVLNGKATSLPEPAYPAAAKAVGAEGSVSVQILIDEQGFVISASAVSGHPLLRAAATDAAAKATFSPTLLSGQPVKIVGVVVYNFVAPKPDDK